MQSFPLHLSLVAATLLCSAMAAPSTFISSAFVPGAAPTVVSGHASTEAALAARRSAVLSGYGLTEGICNGPKCIASSRVDSKLFARKKGGGGAAVKKGGKVQIRILKHLPGTGKIGDVVVVSKAYFDNKLKRDQSAELVTDEEVETEKKEREARAKERKEVALDLQSKIEGLSLEVTRKAGPTGHLFGGLSKKDILGMLKKKFPKGALIGKQVKIVSVKGENGKELGGDIKELGEWTVSISLSKDVAADFQVSVKVEQ